jgi:hypothetical protein
MVKITRVRSLIWQTGPKGGKTTSCFQNTSYNSGMATTAQHNYYNSVIQGGKSIIRQYNVHVTITSFVHIAMPKLEDAEFLNMSSADYSSSFTFFDQVRLSTGADQPNPSRHW